MPLVLIVDDNADNLYMLRSLLQGHGFKVSEARHGAEALVIARQDPPILVISDLLMPVMDGYTLLKHWKNDDQLKAIPFVVYTATYTDPKDERLALNLGADAFIIKPAEPEPFMKRITDILAKKACGELSSANGIKIEENVLLKDYSEVLVHKLEEKAQRLEQANQALQEDIANRRQMEADLRMRDRAIQAVSQGILITDPNQRDNPIIYASDGFQRITGYTPAEALGKNCRFLQGKDTNPDAVKQMREAIAKGQSCHLEILNYRKDGTPFWNALSFNPVFDDNGAISYFVGVQADITDRKSLEDQLRQAQKMEAFGQLAGGVAHDFNNLLTIISGYSELLLAQPNMTEVTQDLVKAIYQAGERAAALTRQLLGFSRRTMLQPKTLNLNAQVIETVKMIRRLIGEDIFVSTVLDPILNQVRVDPGQLDQVLINLAVNARDAMPKGGKLTIETTNVLIDEAYAGTHPDCKPGPHVMLAMSDTGCGMTPEVTARIFEPFFTTKAVGKGTGLGLAMVFGIVQQSGGCIHVYSEPGCGTSFKIYLPAITEHVTKKNDSSSTIDLKGSETILLVEDEEMVRAMALMTLTMQGYKVLTAIDGKDALQVVMAHTGTIDLVLTDVVMPNLSGPELAEAMKARFSKVKFLFTSGYTDDAVVRHGLLHAEVSFIQKPFTPLSLAHKIRQVLNADSTAGR